MLHHLFLFILASLALIFLPGPDMLYIMNRSMTYGRRYGIAAALGTGTGIFIHIFVVSVGLGSLLVKSALVFTFIKFVGACYLFYLGATSLIKKHSLNVTDTKMGNVISWKKVYWQGFITNVLNPKVALFFLAFLPQFVLQNVNYSIGLQLLLLGLIFNCLGTTINIVVACFFSTAKEWLSTHPKLLNIQQKITGVLFIGLGLRLAIVK
jgi:threonine/homoserine/homoserine lactone efflux protein